MTSNKAFYFSSIRGLTAIFGSIFNNIRIERYNSTGKIEKLIKVPIAYAPADKTILMIQQADPGRLVDEVEKKIILPRMSFELTGISYDSNRKTPTTIKNVYPPIGDLTFDSSNSSVVNLSDNIITINNHGLGTGRGIVYKVNSGGTNITGLTNNTTYYVIKVDNNNFKLATTEAFAIAGTAINLSALGSGTHTLSSFHITQFNPVPYNFEYSLYVYVKYIDDGLQIIEQILPYFSPFYSVTKLDLAAFNLTKDVNINLTSVSSEDIYEGSVEEDRIIQWTLTFVANSWIYPPITDTKIIKDIDVNFYELNTTEKLSTINIVVNPLTADKDDSYDVVTTITNY